MSDAFWFLLDHPDQRDLTKLDGNIQYVSPHFDRDVYEDARGVSFMNFEDAYDNWRLYGRRQGLEFAPSKNTILKIILKVKDEVDLIDKWIDHHAKIVGLHNIIIMDCGSTDRRFLDKLDAIRNEAVIFQYDKYYDSLHSYDSNKQFFELLKREARYICILDADEFLFGVSGDSIRVRLRKALSERCGAGAGFRARHGSSPWRHRSAARNRARGGASASSSRTFARRPSGVAAL